jgi:hypothetical protein
MNRHGSRLVLAFVIVLGAALVVLTPASWALWAARSHLPPGFHYARVEGAVLAPRFSGVGIDAAGRLPITALGLAPAWLQMLRGELAVTWRAVIAGGEVRGYACRHAKRWTIAALEGRLDASVVAALVPAWPALRGEVVLNGASLDCAGNGRLVIEFNGLKLERDLALGDYALELSRGPGGAWKGQLTTRDGAALVLNAELRHAPGTSEIFLGGTARAGVALAPQIRAWVLPGDDDAEHPIDWRLPL